jgi:predicted ATPase/class 3 adenylate cyclase
MSALPTGTLTFLFTDIEGSTRLLRSLGSAYGSVHARHQAIVRAAVSPHEGVEVSTEGDAFFVVFRSASDALAAAADTQRALTAERWPIGGEVRVRMGIHTGQGVLVGGDYVGIDVNRAARIAAAANGGQVFVSDAAREATATGIPPGLELRDIGRHRLKDIGVEHLWSAELDDVPLDPRPPRSLEAHPTNLPPELVPLLDREPERAAVLALFDAGARLVTITGAGGSGKSALGLDLARRLLPRFPHGAAQGDGGIVASVDVLARDLADGLGLGLDPSLAPADALLAALRDLEVLLLIETADHLPGVGRLVGRLLAACGRLRIMVTSVVPLRVSGERKVALGPLSTEAGRALFLAHVRSVRPDAATTDADLAAIDAIWAALDGLPLAIELAAGRARLLTPGQILDRLSRQLSFLTGGRSDAPERHRRLVDTIAWSHDAASPAEQELLARLSLFVGPFEVSMAEELGAAEPPVDDPLSALESLAERSLVRRLDAERGWSTRFRLPRSIREFAAERLAERAWADAVRHRVLGLWLRVVSGEVDAIDHGDAGSGVKRLVGVIDDIRASLAWAVGHGDPVPELLPLAAGLGPYWYRRGEAPEGRSWLERALESVGAESATDPTTRSDALFWAGVLADETGDAATAVRRLEACLTLREESGDRGGAARALNSLGVVARSMGDLERAEQLLRRSLEQRREIGDADVGSTLTNLAIVAHDQDRLDEARGLYEEALAADLRRSGEPHPATLLDLGILELRAREDVRGKAHLDEALRRFADVGDTPTVADALLELAVARAGDDDPERTLMLIGAADGLLRRAGLSSQADTRERADAAQARASAAMGAEAARSALTAGGALDLASAVRFATVG